MERLLKVLLPQGAHRGTSRPVRLVDAQPGRHRTPRSNWLVGDIGTPDADEIAIDLLLGDDLRRYL
jgi:hypothetical protein